MPATRRKSKLWSYWGYILLAVMIIGAVVSKRGSIWIFVAAFGIFLLFALFSAPVYCNAINRPSGRGQPIQYCRNNSRGVMLGCHLRNHKFQKFKGWWWKQSAEEKNNAFWMDGPAKMVTVGAVLAALTPIVQAVKPLFKS